jgi:hypothetical protein
VFEYTVMYYTILLSSSASPFSSSNSVTMTEKPQGWYAEDDKAFIEILNSMGVSQFDPLVPIALNEYARREFICRGKCVVE